MQAKGKKQVKTTQSKQNEEAKAQIEKSNSKKTQQIQEETKKATSEHPPPKKPSSAWVFFNTQKSAELRKEGKENVFKLSSEAWNACTEEQKKPYIDLAAEDKQREERQK